MEAKETINKGENGRSKLSIELRESQVRWVYKCLRFDLEARIRERWRDLE